VLPTSSGWPPICPPPASVGITGMHHHIWLYFISVIFISCKKVYILNEQRMAIMGKYLGRYQIVLKNLFAQSFLGLTAINSGKVSFLLEYEGHFFT
jgi:hypothetical protein